MEKERKEKILQEDSNSKDKNLENFLPKFLLSDLYEKESQNEQMSCNIIENSFAKFDIFDPTEDMDSYIELGNSYFEKENV